ncbi:hypothetical protein [Pseudomonas sp. GM25]|uniref:hypothetical protein n=1 Tax=Pseudomonas sp. GM25 TaxID=1144327 RepID=UPI0012F7B975|nr:hypothetical protein [Pseudomonas sp. GM25]
MGDGFGQGQHILATDCIAGRRASVTPAIFSLLKRSIADELKSLFSRIETISSLKSLKVSSASVLELADGLIYHLLHNTRRLCAVHSARQCLLKKQQRTGRHDVASLDVHDESFAVGR